MDNNISRNALSYNEDSNYFEWSEDIHSLQKFIVNILQNDQGHEPEYAAINEDKHHNMFSFKANDCTVKHYLTTQKIIIQGPGSSNLSEKLSQFIEDGEETLQESLSNTISTSLGINEASLGECQLNSTEFDSTCVASQDFTLNQPNCDCFLLKADLKKVQLDIILLKKAVDSKSNSHMQIGEDDETKIKLRDENELLRKEVDLLKTENKNQSNLIHKLESEKASLITSLRILHTDLRTGDEAVSQAAQHGSVNQQNNNTQKPKSKSKKNKEKKKNAQGQEVPRDNAVDKSPDQTNDDDSALNQNHASTKSVIILGDSTIKGIKWWKLPKNDKGPRINIKSFPGCTVDDMESYMLPSLRKDPDEIILHVGTNDLKSMNPQQVAESVVNLADNIVQNSKAKVSLSAILRRSDDPVLSDKVPKVNKVLKTFSTNRGWSFIDHNNIDHKSLNNRGLHLNQQGSSTLSKNFMAHINKSF